MGVCLKPETIYKAAVLSPMHTYVETTCMIYSLASAQYCSYLRPSDSQIAESSETGSTTRVLAAPSSTLHSVMDLLPHSAELNLQIAQSRQQKSLTMHHLMMHILARLSFRALMDLLSLWLLLLPFPAPMSHIPLKLILD